MHFPDIIEQKYCISNVCHCVIIPNDSTITAKDSILCILFFIRYDRNPTVK